MNYQQSNRKSLYQSIYFPLSAQGFWQITLVSINCSQMKIFTYISQRTAPSPAHPYSTLFKPHLCRFRCEKPTSQSSQEVQRETDVTNYLTMWIWKTNTWGKKALNNRYLFSKRDYPFEGGSLGTVKLGKASG